MSSEPAVQAVAHARAPTVPFRRSAWPTGASTRRVPATVPTLSPVASRKLEAVGAAATL
jgi:hypothetical protein